MENPQWLTAKQSSMIIDLWKTTRQSEGFTYFKELEAESPLRRTITNPQLMKEIASSCIHLFKKIPYSVDVKSDLPEPTYQSVRFFSWVFPDGLMTQAVLSLIFGYLAHPEKSSEQNILYLLFNVNEQLLTAISEKLTAPKKLDSQQTEQLQNFLTENKAEFAIDSITITAPEQVNKITAISRCPHLPLYPTPINPQTGLPFANHASKDRSIVTSNHSQGGSLALAVTGQFSIYSSSRSNSSGLGVVQSDSIGHFK